MDQAAADRSPRRGWPALVYLAAGLLVSALALFIAVRSRPPGDASPEAGFARDMATHHAQAAEMAFMVRDAAADERLRTLAYDIIVTQTAQRGIFMGWLQQWKLAQSSSLPRMAWMPAGAHGHMSETAPERDLGSMPGMASAAELGHLREATGRSAEILFLQLMIRHHEGGVEMARAIIVQSHRGDVVSAARSIESAQVAEIAEMTGMLTDRGATPYPSILR